MFVAIKDPRLQKEIKNGTASVREISQYLLQNYPVTAICDALAEVFIVNDNLKPIVITKDQFETYFRIQGYKQDGSKENRGKQKK